jgi:hypothetical protein
MRLQHIFDKSRISNVSKTFIVHHDIIIRTVYMGGGGGGGGGGV